MEPAVQDCIRVGLQAAILEAQRDLHIAEETGNAEAQSLAATRWVDAMNELIKLED